MNTTVTFETKCWENDWELLLRTNLIKTMIDRNNFAFEKRVLIINNVKDTEKVKYYAQKLIDKKILTNFYLAKDFEKDVFDFFQISKESLGKGYVYSIAELVGIYTCQTDYLLHFSSDAILYKKTDWIQSAIKCFEKDYKCKMATLTWNKKYQEAKNESFAQDGDFFIGYGFSDQMYLIKTADFRQPIYCFYHPSSDRYPKYGGELFEKRVDSWMRTHEFHRYVHKLSSYQHKNFPKRPFQKKLYLMLKILLGY